MVRALVIRQIFVVIDLALALAVVVAAVMVTQSLFSNRAHTPVAIAGTNSETLAVETSLREVGPRPHYNGIVQSRIFGPAGSWSPDLEPAAPPEPEPVQEEIDTSLRLRLLGVSAVSPTDPFSAAIIQDDEQRGTLPGTFTPGDYVLDDVTLEEVHPRMVILQNYRNSPATRERLSMDESDDGARASAQNAGSIRMAGGRPTAGRTPPSRMPAQSQRPSDSDRIELNRQEVLEGMYVNYSDLVTKLRPELQRDEQGNVTGITAENIEEIPLAGTLGLQNGDVLQTINGDRIDSEQRIIEILARHQNASTFRIGILRDGQPRVINYRLN